MTLAEHPTPSTTPDGALADEVGTDVDVAEADVDDARWPVEAARGADDKLATDVVVLEVGALLALTGHFVIATGANPRQVRAIAEEVEHRVVVAGGPKPVRVEGLDERTWVLIDYGDFVVHVFSAEAREYYDLERLWGDVPKIDWRDPAAARPPA